MAFPASRAALHSDKMAQAPTSTSTCFSKDDIIEAITDNARNNFNKVIGLPYFCVGSECSPSAPNLKMYHKCIIPGLLISKIDSEPIGMMKDVLN